MSFNHLQPASGPFTLAPGASTRIMLWYPGGGTGQAAGEDRGAQWIMADPVGAAPPPLPQSLTVSDFTKVREFKAGAHPQGTLGFLDMGVTVVRYEVTVKNTGKNHAKFTIQGGGNT